MLRPLGATGRTSWIVWFRRPRLKSAVQRVATLTPISFSRVASLSEPGFSNVSTIVVLLL